MTTIKDLENKLLQLYHQKLRVDALTFAMLMLISALLALFCIFLMDYMTDFPLILRILMTLTVFAVFFFVLPKKRSKSVIKNKNIMEITREVEAKASKKMPGGFHSILISAVEFTEKPQIGGSRALKKNVIKASAKTEYSPGKIKLYNRERISLTLKLGGLMLVCYLVWGLLGHHSMLTFFKRSIGFSSFYLTNTQITHINSPKYLTQFEDVQIDISIAGKKPNSGLIHLDLNNGESFDLALLPDTKDESKYHATIKQVETSFTFYIEIGDAYRQKRYVEVISAPVIKTAEIKITSPKYTNLPVKEKKFEPLEMVEGSKVSFNVIPDREIKNCIFIYNGKEYHMKKEGKAYKLQTGAIKKSGVYSVKLEDAKGIFNNKRLDFALSLIRDTTPSMEVKKPSGGTSFAPNSKMYWNLNLSDDYGLANLYMKYIVYNQNEDESLITIKKDTVSLQKFKDEREAKVRGVFELASLKLKPGQILGIEFIIKDHKPDRKDEDHSTSGMMKMNIITAEELKQLIESEMIGLKNMLKDIQTDIKFQSKSIQIYQNKGEK